MGRLAKTTGIAESTICFYEREGLLRPAGRTSGNYRLYRRDAAERLAFIRAALAAGFELGEIQAMFAIETGRVHAPAPIGASLLGWLGSETRCSSCAS